MTGVKNEKISRKRYVRAGYKNDGAELYISDVPAGSAKESLRDLNRAGYQSTRPWRDSPEPALDDASVEKKQMRRTRASGTSKGSVSKQGLFAWIAAEAPNDRKDVAICIMLFCVILMLMAAWGQRMVQGVQIQRSIAEYRSESIRLDQESEQLSRQLELAKNGERIRNLAQNELGMLRPERAQTEEIYIQLPDDMSDQTVQEEGNNMEILDFMLGLLNVFHIGE